MSVPKHDEEEEGSTRRANGRLFANRSRKLAFCEQQSCSSLGLTPHVNRPHLAHLEMTMVLGHAPAFAIQLNILCWSMGLVVSSTCRLAQSGWVCRATSRQNLHTSMRQTKLLAPCLSNGVRGTTQPNISPRMSGRISLGGSRWGGGGVSC